MNPKYRIRIPYLVDHHALDHELSLEEFKSIITPLLDEAVAPIGEAMHQAGIRKGELGLVVLAGGSSQLPGLCERVAELTGKEPCTFPRDLMYAVAYGAALYHRRVRQLPLVRREERILGDGLGILVRDAGTVSVKLMLTHNVKLPAHCEFDFLVPEGNDTVTKELRRGSCTEPALTRRLRSKNLQLRRRAEKIRVNLEVDRNRVISLRAFDPADPESEIAFELDGKWDEEKIVAVRQQLGIEVPGTSDPRELSSSGHPCIGIDVGTTTCIVAYTTPAGRPLLQCLEHPEPPLGYDHHCYPAVVYFANGWQRPEVATRTALAALASAGSRGAVFASFKTADWSRTLGTVEGRPVTARDLTAHLLARLWSDATAALGKQRRLTSAVVTVPASFGPDECADVYHAARVAGIEEVILVDEPAAAFLYYQHEFPEVASNEVGTVLVFDFGGGTADVAIIDVSQEPELRTGDTATTLFPVLASAGNVRCGGRDVDRKLAEYLREVFEKETGIQLRNAFGARRRLLEAAEKAKVELSRLAQE